MVPTEDEKETLADLGLALHEVQVTEHFMRTILLFVLQKPRSGGLNAAAWDADSALLVRMTMGNLIVTLRSRVDRTPASRRRSRHSSRTGTLSLIISTPGAIPIPKKDERHCGNSSSS